MSTRPAAPLIVRPDRQSTVQRTAFGLLTAVMWTLYIYLLLPLVTLIAWIFGFRRFYTTLFGDVTTVDPFLVTQLPLIALACAVTLLAWAEYNRMRFQGKENRLETEHVGPSQLDQALGAKREIGERMRSSARILSVTLNDQSEPVMVNAKF